MFETNVCLQSSMVQASKQEKADRDDEEHPPGLSDEMTIALWANSSIFNMEKPQSLPPWFIKITPPSTFVFQTSSSVELPKSMPARGFEYGAAWVEHYYYSFVEECRRQNRLELVQMLYHWYCAQFTIDYIDDVYPLSSEQYLASSNLVNDASSLELVTEENDLREMVKACRHVMQRHDQALSQLPPRSKCEIKAALNGFYSSVVEQFSGISQKELFSRMSLEEYIDFRTLNAGGDLGFYRQIYLFSLLDATHSKGEHILQLGRVVGWNVALMNDLYGLRKDVSTGDANVILKHQHAHHCDLGESIQWATEEILKTVKQIQLYYTRHPETLETLYNIPMACVSGNHGFHEACKRYELPAHFKWPEEL